MAVREDCRHYSTRTTAGDEVVQRCRMDMAEATPFACPVDCIFFESRSITDAGWQRFDRPQGPDDAKP
ncbi:MAG TPA: hypothetical protein VIR58_01535 [Acidimicrobiales bacterium]